MSPGTHEQDFLQCMYNEEWDAVSQDTSEFNFAK